MEVCEVIQLIQKVIESGPEIDCLYEIKVLTYLSVDGIKNAIREKFGDAVSVWADVELRIDIGCVDNVDKSLAVTYGPEGISITCKRTVKGRNWCNLPAEMKLKCIEYMDFRTRWRFRYTARAERELAESFKREEIIVSVFDSGHDQDQLCIREDSHSFNFEHLMTLNKHSLPAVSRVAKTIWRMGYCGGYDFGCSNGEILMAMMSGTPEDTEIRVRDVKLASASRTDMYDLKRCTGIKYLDVSFCEEEKIAFGEVWEALKPLLPFQRFRVENVHWIEVDEVLLFIDEEVTKRTTRNEWIPDADFKVHVVSQFDGTDEVYARIWDKFGDRVSDSMEDAGLRINVTDSVKIDVACDHHKVHISCDGYE